MSTGFGQIGTYFDRFLEHFQLHFKIIFYLYDHQIIPLRDLKAKNMTKIYVKTVLNSSIWSRKKTPERPIRLRFLFLFGLVY